MSVSLFLIELPSEDSNPSQSIVQGVRSLLLLDQVSLDPSDGHNASYTSDFDAITLDAVQACNELWPITEGSPEQTVFPRQYFDHAEIQLVVAGVSTPVIGLSNVGDCVVFFNRGSRTHAA